MKNNNNHHTKQLSPLTRITSLLYSAIACSFIFVTSVIAQQPTFWQQFMRRGRGGEQQYMLESQPLPENPIMRQVPMRQPMTQQQMMQQQQQPGFTQQQGPTINIPLGIPTQQQIPQIITAAQAQLSAVNALKGQLNNTFQQAINHKNPLGALQVLQQMPALYDHGANQFLSDTLTQLAPASPPCKMLRDAHTKLKLIAHNLSNEIVQIINVFKTTSFDKIVSVLGGKSREMENYMQQIKSLIAIIQQAKPAHSFYQKDPDPVRSALQALVLHYANTCGFCIESTEKIIRMQIKNIQQEQLKQYKQNPESIYHALE